MKKEGETIKDNEIEKASYIVREPPRSSERKRRRK